MVRPPNIRVVILTGLSGSGKSTALKALEDIGFLCIDNLPVDLLPRFLELRDEGGREATKAALVMDVREPTFLERYGPVFHRMERAGFNLEIVFLEADDDALIRRYSQTRRTHPLAAGEMSVAEAIVAERRAMESLRGQADLVVNTTELSVHELKHQIQERFSAPPDNRRLRVGLMSFGFKYGLPLEADLVMDVRFLPNPYFDESLRPLTGLQAEVVDYVFRDGQAGRFLDRYADFLTELLPLYEKEGKAYLTVALGCTGGRHRSVAVVEALAQRLQSTGYLLTLRHRDIDLG